MKEKKKREQKETHADDIMMSVNRNVAYTSTK